MTYTPTHHTDEPSVDDLLKLCARWMDSAAKIKASIIENLGPSALSDDFDQIETIARALHSRLSHPTLSADRESVLRLAEYLYGSRKGYGHQSEWRSWDALMKSGDSAPYITWAENAIRALKQ